MILASARRVQFTQQHFQETKRQAGERLASVLETHGSGILRAGYGEQTTMVDAMLAALAEPENAAAVTSTGLNGFVDRFRQTEEAFKELVRRRQDDDAAADIPLRRGTRIALHEDLNLIHASISFLGTINQESTEPAIAALNERIQDVTTPAKARRTREGAGSSISSNPVSERVAAV